MTFLRPIMRLILLVNVQESVSILNWSATDILSASTLKTRTCRCVTTHISP